ncbi:PPOX class F420-dependent oxidoreductase [Actinopolymorpha singaporensis]
MTAVLPEELKKLVDEEKVFATVATLLPDGQPHLTVVWVKRDGDELLFSTIDDRVQGRNLARDPRISMLISPPDEPYTYTEIRGTAGIVPDPDSRLPHELLLKYLGRAPAEGASETGRIIVRVTPERITRWPKSA